MKLFLYGTLRDARVRAGRSGNPRLAKPGVPALLTGWRLAPLHGTRFPTLRRSRHQGAHGVLVRAGAAAVARLSAYEGARYRLRRVRVIAADRPVLAWAWIADGRAAQDHASV